MRRLNSRRERDLDKTIDNAKILVKLYNERNCYQSTIEDIESGKRQERALKEAKYQECSLIYKVLLWESLKVGGELPLGNKQEPIITKKNAKSVYTGECKWTRQEIIGKEAHLKYDEVKASQLYAEIKAKFEKQQKVC